MSTITAAQGTIDRIPTGIPYLDRLIGGGQLSTGIHGLLGPIGAGKTTLGTMIATEGAMRLHQHGLAGCWIFVSLDECAGYIEQRALSHASQTPRQLVEAAYCGNSISRIDQFGDLEWNRFQATYAILANHLQIIDLSTAESSALFRRRPIRRIAERIAELPQPIAGIVLDYAGSLVLQVVNETGLSPRATSQCLRNVLTDCREEFAMEFRCPVWVVHQMNWKANSRSAGVSPHHQDAADCRSFGARLDISVGFGTWDRKQDCMQLACSKAPNLTSVPPPELVTFHKEFATIIEDRQHRFNPVTRRIEVPHDRAPLDAVTRAALDTYFEQRDAKVASNHAD